MNIMRMDNSEHEYSFQSEDHIFILNLIDEDHAHIIVDLFEAGLPEDQAFISSQSFDSVKEALDHIFSIG